MPAADLVPQLPELRAPEVLPHDRVLGDLLLGLLDHAVEGVRVVDATQERFYRLGMRLVVEPLGQLVHGVALELPLPYHRAEIVRGAVRLVEELILDEVLVDGLRVRRGEARLLAVHGKRPSAEEVNLDLLGALPQCLLDVAL